MVAILAGDRRHSGGGLGFKEVGGRADINNMGFRRASINPAAQRLPWLIAATLVVVASVLIASWLDRTAAKVDEDTLGRGADAVTANVEEQIRILELAGSGAQGLIGQSVDDLDLYQLASQIDVTVLRSLVAMVVYPVGDGGTLNGSFVELGLVPIEFDVPPITVSLAEIDRLVESGDAFLSDPVHTTDPSRHDLVVAVPVAVDAGTEMVGVIFRPDSMLEVSVDGAGESQYSVALIDTRSDNLVVTSVGEPVSDLEVQRFPDGLKGALELVVRPGPDFPFSQSGWIPALVIAAGIILALLLVWMARMAQTRSDDLAERLRLAQELNEGKDRFLATVSHELRTPLTVVLGVAAEIGPSWDDFSASDRQDLLTMMTEQAAEAANIVEDLLVAARSDPGQLRLAMEPTELRPHIEYALASLPNEAIGRIRWPDTSYVVSADTTRLRQIIRNLLENAVRYGGPSIEVRSQQEGEHIVLTVRDDGGGIEDGDFERIFEPYERSETASVESPTGVGIGLYVSRLLARLMGGDLQCTRSAGHTEFRLRLSRADPIPVSDPEIELAAS